MLNSTSLFVRQDRGVLKDIVLATRNKKKLSELKRLLKGLGARVRGLDSLKGLPEVKEDRHTFEGNAVKKALEISKHVEGLVISDDSGLEVPALDNAPGIYSARYAGPGQDDNKNIAKLLKNLKNLKDRDRKARFRCVICIAKGDRVIKIIKGAVRGRIALERYGMGGFGYDPVFIPKGFTKTFAQISQREKDKISHRGIALRKAKAFILRYFQRYPL